MDRAVTFAVRFLYEPGVSMVCCRASAAAAVDALACLNHGNEILRRCDLSAVATCVSARRDPGRCGGISDGILDDDAGAGAAGTATTTTAADDSPSARRPPPELGASIDQNGSPSTGGRLAGRLPACLPTCQPACPPVVLLLLLLLLLLLDRSPPPPRLKLRVCVCV